MNIRVNLHPKKTPAVILGMIGSTLVAVPAAAAHLAGFACWMIGNSLWVLYGISEDDWHIITLFSFYFITALLGAYFLLN
ncbi:hypothetical protein F1737_04370 [Methanoplanus sp. FWC-SCC4]|uniref:Uncharacterized protein n=1 Tax=Methanochimaera problematica TaxID=2609417 RepID=A0AA97I285_9EURY|nr:hypothetical protein [Methanoplanus sp. FWC-SCC4]WOF15990.1 hypothetical protein F1737_04370 [Methanoplanus sp. FWC-SCC4]